MVEALHFVGFSTTDKFKPPYTVTDIELVKVDLMNHFGTRKGERVMVPEFGTIIYDLLMEPMDARVKKVIIDDVTRIVQLEPRVKSSDIKVTEIEQALLIEIQLLYLPDGITYEMAVQFNTEGQE